MANPLLITDTDITGVLKNVYADYRINAFPLLTPLLANIKKGKPGGPENLKWGGNGVFWDVALTRPVGMHSSPNGFFPPQGNSIERQANLGIQRLYVQRQIDGLAIKGTQAGSAAFIPLVRKIVTEAMESAKLGQQEFLHGNGTGTKGLVTTVTDTTHIVVSSPFGVASAGQGGLLLDTNMFISVNAGATSTSRGTATITAITNSGDSATLTLGTAIASMAAGDAIVSASTSDNAYGNFPNGLINITNRGAAYNSFEGISAASFARWDATRMVAGTDTDDASSLSEMDVWDLVARVAGASGKDANLTPSDFLLLTTPGVYRKIGETFLGQREFSSPASQMQIKGGFKALNIQGIPLVKDQWCPAGTVYLIHLPTLTFIDLMDWQKLAYDDSGTVRFISGRDAYELNWGSYVNVGALQRNSHGSLTGITDTKRYSHVQ